MKYFLLFGVSLLPALCLPMECVVTAQDVQYESPEQAAADPDFRIQGEYAGANLGMQVVARGDGEFELVLFAGGLPGAGWDRTPPQRIEGDAESVKNVADSKKLKRIERKSPSLNAVAPAGAVVLFDGTEKSLEAHWQKGARRTNDGLLMQGATTKETFADYTLHVEFRTPFEPKREGQGRGNSGVYHQGRYETQVLDSFGLEGKNNEAGGIYTVRDPDLNMCFPPLSWQTYDVDFTAARFDTNGKKSSNAKLSVRLNGILVQSDVEVPNTTTAAPVPETNEPGPIYLQDHGNPVRFKNIWLLPRNADKEARRPILPGFERLFADEALSGRLLLSQLGCTACHANNDPSIPIHTGPILDNVGTRIRFDHLHAIANDAHAAKPGTAMPDFFHGMSDPERRSTSDAIASFLASTGDLIDRAGDSAAAQRGELLYHSIGCVACHAPRKGNVKQDASNVPLGEIELKYTLDGLTKFLIDPHAFRPNGNMPRLVNSPKEARDIACFLLGDKIISTGSEHFSVKVYHGSWDKLPEFEKLKPVSTGITNGLDLSIAGRTDNFALQFEAYLPIGAEGDYQFFLSSDDGSRLWIDGESIVEVDGIHPVIERTSTKRLSKGVHKVRIDYFEKGGGEDLFLEVEGPDTARVPIAMLTTSDSNGLKKKELVPSQHTFDSKLVPAGKAIFEKVGCANCHRLTIEGATTTSSLRAPALSALSDNKGCLATAVRTGLPQYDLAPKQRTAISAALVSLKKPIDAKSAVHLQLASKNCYACHTRGTLGGPEAAKEPFFTTKMQEMGNEGRLPPPLTGVGDKLKSDVIDAIIASGSKDRPYMVTRMPAFGKDAVSGLREKLIAIDQRVAERKSITTAHPDDAKNISASGRKLVGSDGLACVKCHVYGGKGAPGLQAIDLARMSERLREDWFHRYLLAPTEYRPGTRMPLSFTAGKSVLTSVYDGDADKQVDAMWLYLTQKDARPPSGIDAEAIVLVPDARPVLYRNFIEGLGPRGIGVGYPERVNLAWDAGNMNLAMIWKNDFIDASKHWVGRGPGFQGPLGDDIVKFETGSFLAKLSAPNDPWPNETARARGFAFLGYQLNQQGQPTFRYRMGHMEVTDSFVPITEKNLPIGLERRLSFTMTKPTEGIVFRLARGKITSSQKGEYLINGQWKIILKDLPITVLSINDQQELRGALPETGKLSIVETILW